MNRFRRIGADAAGAVALFVLGAVLAIWTERQFRVAGIQPEFYQLEFSPAAMFACGHGFRVVDWSQDRALSAFLRREPQQDALACDAVSRAVPDVEPNSLQRISLYLEWAVALTWRLAGVSWPALWWLNALLAGLFGALVYGVMRLGMRPLVAAAFSAVVVTSPFHLSNVPQLRDYSKAPFLMAVVLLMGIVVKRALSRRQLLLVAGLGGAVAGIGFGFRTDILLAAVPFAAALIVFRAGALAVRSRFAEGVAAALVFAASFALIAAPVLGGYAKGGNSGHVVLLGFGDSFNPGLGVESHHYSLAGPYSDSYQDMVVRGYTSRVTGDTHLFSVGSDDYDRESGRYLMAVVRTFPADVAVRALGAVAQVLDGPFAARYANDHGWIQSARMARLYDRRADVLMHAGWLGCLAAACVIVGIGAWSVRCAVFLICLVATLGGGAALQFEGRHHFYLEFMPWWALGAIADRGLAFVRAIPAAIRKRAWRSGGWAVRVGVGVARSAAVAGAVVIGTVVVLGACRYYQQRSITRLFDRTLAAAGPPMSVTSTPDAGGTVTLTVDLPELDLPRDAWTSRSMGMAYLVIDVKPERCDTFNLAARVRYQSSAATDFTTSLMVPLADPPAGSTVKILLPVYAAVWPAASLESRFSGIELSARDATCIASISKVGDLRSFPVLTTAILGPDWRHASHYQTLSGLESRDDGLLFRARLYATLPALDLRRSVMARPTTDVFAGALLVSRAAAANPPSGLTVDGTPESAFAYLLQSGVSVRSRGACAIADGELRAGGLTFGLLRDGKWYQQVGVIDRGRFVAVGCVQEAGNYSIVLANDNRPGRPTVVRLARIGWVAGGPPLHD